MYIEQGYKGDFMNCGDIFWVFFSVFGIVLAICMASMPLIVALLMNSTA